MGNKGGHSALPYQTAIFGDRRHEPHEILVRTILPYPCPLPQGEGELSTDGLERRKTISVHGPNAYGKKPKEGFQFSASPVNRAFHRW
jgi:hypothetical protein